MNEAENTSSMQALSALVDGEADAALAASLSAAWRDDAALRERWHAYHLIGDVLRSDELAGAGHDAAFLQRLRLRLEQEPVVLAPLPAIAAAVQPPVARVANGAPVPARRTRRWTAPAAVAAGFMVVAGVLTVTRVPVGPQPAPTPQLARSDAPLPALPVARGLVGPVAVADAVPEDAAPTNGVLIRDARLDQYLSAHKQFGGSSALGMPAGFLRSATFEGPSAAPGFALSMLRGFVTTGLRAAPALLLAGAALLAHAQAVEPAAGESRDAKYWLTRIHHAAGERNFQGTFVVSAGGSVASARIAHFCRGPNQYERIESLDGQRRHIYRHNDLVHSFWPHERIAVVETRQAMREFPALLTAGADRIVEHYEVEPLGEGRVAGHAANVLLLRPRDGWRFGYRLWAEKESGLLLRAEVFDQRDVVLEASAFSELMIGVKPQPEQVLQAMKQLDGYDIRRPVLATTDLDREGWVFKQMPPGFRHVSSVRRPMDAQAVPLAAAQRGDQVEVAADPAEVLQTIYSDGLTHVSVFIEPYDARLHRREMLMALGATQTLVRRQGDWWLTVIGDVPKVTLRAFADGLERRR